MAEKYLRTEFCDKKNEIFICLENNTCEFNFHGKKKQFRDEISKEKRLHIRSNGRNLYYMAEKKNFRILEI